LNNTFFLRSQLFHLKAFHFIYSDKGDLQLNLSKSEEKGFSFYFAETHKYRVFIQAAERNVLKKIENWVRSNKKPSEILEFFNNVATAFLYEKDPQEFWVISDSMGMNPLFFKRTASSIEFASMILPLSEQKLEVDTERLHELLGFGFTLPHSKSLFQGIEKIQKNKIFNLQKGLIFKEADQEVYWKINKYEGYDKKEIAELFVNSMEEASNPMLGVTSGKDSLAIISALRAMGKEVKLFNFGNRKSSDVLQAKALAEEINAQVHFSDLVLEQELEEILTAIGMYSSGRATASYVDMFKMIKSLETQGHTIVMGEGGENIRDFFTPSDLSIVEQVSSHITPFAAFSSVIDIPLGGKEEYFDYLQRLLDRSDFVPKDDPLLSYYRNVRFPNNFVLRSALLQPLASKFTPFLDRRFAEATFSINSDCYKKSGIHRSLVEVLAPDFLHYFDEPLQGEPDSQNWHLRFQEYVGAHFLKFFKQSQVEITGLNKENLIRLIEKNIRNPSRDIYMIFRLVSLFYFLEKSINSPTIFEELDFSEIIF
jgi:hypothetical protein